jgi:hypothetical protein
VQVAERPVANISCIYSGENKFMIHVYKNDMHTEKRGERNNYGNDCHRQIYYFSLKQSLDEDKTA